MEKAVKARLGTELLCLVDGVGTPLSHAAEVTTVRSSRGDRAAFRLQFSDGRVLKGRRFKSAAQAEDACRLLAELPRSMFSDVLACNGAALLEQWVEGEVLKPHLVCDTLLRKAGQMLAGIHRHPFTGTSTHDRSDFDRIVRRVLRNLRVLIDGGVVASDMADRLEGILRDVRPSRAEFGVVHGDFCPQNLLCDQDGQLRSIDNGAIGMGALDDDLCRTFQRWPMTESERAVFLGGYRVHRDPASYCESRSFWNIVVLSNSARVHLECGSRETSNLVERLVCLATQEDF